MVEVTKDRKSDTYIITKTDSEGFHKQINVTNDDLGKISMFWHEINPEK